VAQTQPNVAGILKKVGETYKAATEYELAAKVSVGGSGTGTTGHMRFAFKAPNRYRMEGAIPGMMAGGSGSSGAVAVHDGSALWFYLPASNRYGSIPASAMTEDAPGDLGDARPEATDHFMTIRYRGATEYATGARMVREEAIDFGGAKAECYVVSFTEEEGKTAYT
jgi:outer membrane lipoprotein-sorting protein